MGDPHEKEKDRHGPDNHKLNLQKREQSLTNKIFFWLLFYTWRSLFYTLVPEPSFQAIPSFLWRRYKEKEFKIRSFDWPNPQKIPYEHFYIEGPVEENDDEDGKGDDDEMGGYCGRCIRFDFRPYSMNSEEENNPYKDKDMFLYSFLPPDKEHKEVTTFTMTKDVWKRMNFVCSATNFSFCLRNSEHLVNYIVQAKWNCNQMQIDEKLRVFFDKTLIEDSRKYIALLPLELKKEERKKMDKERKPIFKELETEENEPGQLEIESKPGQLEIKSKPIKFRKQYTVEEFKKKDTAMDYNIIFAGPTGAGKSTLINLAFNETICKTDVDTSSSVTREVTILSGDYMCKDNEEICVNIFDTMGVCDTYLANDEVINDLMKSINTDKSKIVIVCHGKIKMDHIEAIKVFLKNLDYENNRDNFIFLYNKSELMTKKEKVNGLNQMGEALGVTINHEIKFSVPDGKGNRNDRSYYTGVSTGFKTDTNTFSDDCKLTFKVLTDQILPQASNDYFKRKIGGKK